MYQEPPSLYTISAGLVIPVDRASHAKTNDAAERPVVVVGPSGVFPLARLLEMSPANGQKTCHPAIFWSSPRTGDRS